VFTNVTGALEVRCTSSAHTTTARFPIRAATHAFTFCALNTPTTCEAIATWFAIRCNAEIAFPFRPGAREHAIIASILVLYIREAFVERVLREEISTFPEITTDRTRSGEADDFVLDLLWRVRGGAFQQQGCDARDMRGSLRGPRDHNTAIGIGYGSSARPKSSGNLTKMATERTPK
jgi:hypothetical protein